MLKVLNLAKSFPLHGQNMAVLDNISFTLKAGEFVVIFGPNGCGKTTLLNIVAGLEGYYSGYVGKASGTKVNFMFQNYREALFPWLQVRDNIALPLRLQRVPKTESYQRVSELIAELEVDLDLNAYPYQLSSGQQQLVAILRGIVSKADLFIMDEPFSSLDYSSTLLMEQKLLSLWERYKFSVLFVTHAAGEAVLLADRILVMGHRPGRIVGSISVDLPRPRPYSLITTPKFNRLKEQVINTCFTHSTFLNANP